MKRYIVDLQNMTTGSYEIDANNEEEAMEIAVNLFMNDDQDFIIEVEKINNFSDRKKSKQMRVKKKKHYSDNTIYDV